MATAASSYAASYYVVVPVPNRSPTAGNVMVSLTGYALPAGQVGATYVGFDFNTVLQVLGDPGFDPANVRWSVAGGSLPAGLSLSSNGRLTGAPTAAGTVSFHVLAAYKTKAGEQSYQLFIAKLPGNGTLSVTSLDFGGQPVGAQTAARTVSLTNIGGDTLGVAGVSGTGPFAVSTTCPASLAPNESCASSVTFSPTAMGPVTGSMKVSTSNGDRAVDLSGTGLETQLAVAPATVSFGNVNTNASGTQTFTLTNQGNTAATSLSYSTPADVTESDNCGQTLAAGASCTVTLKYAPTTATPLTAPLTVSAQDSSAPVSLTGTPTCPGGTVTLGYSGADQSVKAPVACGHASVAMWGAGGGGYSGTGGGGGYAGATVPVPANATLLVQPGQGGTGGTSCEYGSGQCTSSPATYAGGYGGGGSFLYINGTLAMAAGGGGGGGGSGGGTTYCPSYAVTPAGGVGGAGGAGGGTAGLAGGGASSTAPTSSAGGGGGAQGVGGAGGSMPTGGGGGQAGYYLHGGPASSLAGYNYGGGGISGYGYWGNGASGGGGGGYYGGGSGGTGGGCSGGAGGGGGSGYIMPGVTGTLTAGSGPTPGNAGSGLRGGAGTGGINGPGLNGVVSITWQQ